MRKEADALAKWSLPGNGAAEARLREAAARGTLPHAALFTGEGGEAAALFTAAAFQCSGGAGNRPCGQCAGCRKVRLGIHPDVTVVRDDKHKNIAIDVARSVRSDAYLRPNEGERKVYIFPDCGVLTEEDQDVLLKIVEEGPPYAAFLFCGENPAAVRPTLRSRCVEVRLRPREGAAGPDAAVHPDAAALCRAMAAKKPGGVTEALIRLERGKCSREDLSALLDAACGLFAAAALRDCGADSPGEAGKIAASVAKSLTKGQIMGTIELLQKYRRQCRYNISPGQALGALAVGLEEIL